MSKRDHETSPEPTVAELLDRIRTLEAQRTDDSGAGLAAALLREIQGRNPTRLDAQGVSPERQKGMTTQSPGRRYRNVVLIGFECRALARVCSDAAHPDGIVVDFVKFAYPTGMLAYQARGGRVPDGMKISRDPTQNMTVELMAETGREPDPLSLAWPYTLWKLETFYRPCRDAWIGKPLRAHFCDPDGDGLRTPWEGEEVAEAAE